MRRRRALLTPLAIAALAAACGPGGGSRGPDRETLRLAVSVPPRNLDPRLATDAASERVNRLLYRSLTELDARGLPVPGIAAWERPEPGLYRFRLGDSGRTFGDGSRLAAQDAAATYESILDPATASPHRALLAGIAGLHCPDRDTLEVRLRAPDPLFPAYLGIGILPAAGLAAGRSFADAPVGSGRFRLAAPPEPGRLRLTRRRDGQALELLTVRDPGVRAMKLLGGEVDLLQNDLSPELADWLATRDGVRMETAPGSNCTYLGFNLADPVLALAPVRRAIAHAIDRDALLRYLFRGRARPAEGLLPPDHWAGRPGLPHRAYDPGLARALLADAGFGPGRPLRLSYKTSSDPFRVRLATAIQAQLGECGIALAVQGFDWGTFFGDVKSGRFQLFALTWVGVRTPDIFRYAFHSAAVPPHGANRGRYRSAAADRLIALAGAGPTLPEQAAAYGALQDLLYADLPYLPLWFEDQVALRRARVQGYRLAPDGNYDALEEAVLGVPATGGPVHRKSL